MQKVLQRTLLQRGCMNASQVQMRSLNAASMTQLPLRMRSYGNISDQDRIFTNVYKDQDPFIDGALKRGDWHQTKDRKNPQTVLLVTRMIAMIIMVMPVIR